MPARVPPDTKSRSDAMPAVDRKRQGCRPDYHSLQEGVKTPARRKCGSPSRNANTRIRAPSASDGPSDRARNSEARQPGSPAVDKAWARKHPVPSFAVSSNPRTRISSISSISAQYPNRAAHVSKRCAMKQHGSRHRRRPQQNLPKAPPPGTLAALARFRVRRLPGIAVPPRSCLLRGFIAYRLLTCAARFAIRARPC